VSAPQRAAAVASARRLERWSWRALPGLALGCLVSPRRAHALERDLGFPPRDAPPPDRHPRTWTWWEWLLTAAFAPALLLTYPLVLGWLAIVYAIDRFRAREAGELGGDRE
jgi:hypothetical protein